LTVAYDWQCPYCKQFMQIDEKAYASSSLKLLLDNADGPKYLSMQFTVCRNGKCKKATLIAQLWHYDRFKDSANQFIRSWTLLPAGPVGRAIPEYVPAAIREDYAEGFAIKDLSPKSAAALARRCLQGMIRDFFQIHSMAPDPNNPHLAKAQQTKKLFHEIAAIEPLVDPDTWRAIDVVRRVGNIGAHMELDVNVVVDVEPDEAAKLLGLVELLIDDWYITRRQRQERLQAIIALGEAKDAEREQAQKGSSEQS
jgi:hypothetical protein